MTDFFQTGSAKVDDKGRVVFPAAFKNAMSGDGADRRLVVKKDIYQPCLEMYTYDEWKRQSEEIKSRLDLVFNKEHALFWRTYMSDCAVVVPDDKLGRLSVPKELWEAIGATKEVVFAGVGYKIEIWAREVRERTRIPAAEMEALAGKILSEMR